MRQKLIDDLASAAWSVLNFDNDPGCEPEGPANWKALTSAMERALEKHADRASEEINRIKEVLFRHHLRRQESRTIGGTMSERVTTIKIDDVLRFVVKQTQPVAFSELTEGFKECLMIEPFTTLDHLNDLVQQGFFKVDKQGRFSCRG